MLSKISHAKKLLFVAIILIFIDQIIKVYIKTHFLIGEEINLIGKWFKIHFIENDGMAYGLKFSEGLWAKLLLTFFRFFAIGYGIYYFIKNIFPKNYFFLNYVIIIIIAGAIGNLIDSIFYGVIFTESSTIYDLQNRAVFTLTNGYNTWFQGKVVDMIYCPMIRTILPNWIPIYGGQPYEFFSPIFNFADSCISVGVATLLIFNKKFLTLLSHDKPSNTNDKTNNDIESNLIN